MSTIRSSIQAGQPPPDGNPYFYGWRDVVVRDEQGRRRVEPQPLTRDDVLHPREGDHVTQNTDHNRDCSYLFHVLGAQVASELATMVYGDLQIQWDVPGLRPNGPDIFLVRGLRDPQRRRDSFSVADEGVRPELIIEVTSPSTRDVDLNDKRRIYWQAQIPVYIIVDEQWQRGQRQLRILPYRRGPRAYRKQRLNARGRFWLDAVQLWLGQENGRVALYNAQGQRLLGPNELNDALQQAQNELQQARAEIARLQNEMRNPPQL